MPIEITNITMDDFEKSSGNKQIAFLRYQNATQIRNQFFNILTAEYRKIETENPKGKEI